MSLYSMDTWNTVMLLLRLSAFSWVKVASAKPRRTIARYVRYSATFVGLWTMTQFSHCRWQKWRTPCTRDVVSRNRRYRHHTTSVVRSSRYAQLDGDDFYRGVIDAAQDGKALAFASPKQLQVMNRTLHKSITWMLYFVYSKYSLATILFAIFKILLWNIFF